LQCAKNVGERAVQFFFAGGLCNKGWKRHNFNKFNLFP
jgi:hypothetical protein